MSKRDRERERESEIKWVKNAPEKNQMKARTLLCAQYKCNVLCYLLRCPHLVFFSRENRSKSPDKRYITLHISMCCHFCLGYMDYGDKGFRLNSSRNSTSMHSNDDDNNSNNKRIRQVKIKTRKYNTTQHNVRAIFMFILFAAVVHVFFIWNSCICCAETWLHYTLATNLKLILRVIQFFRVLCSAQIDLNLLEFIFVLPLVVYLFGLYKFVFHSHWSYQRSIKIDSKIMADISYSDYLVLRIFEYGHWTQFIPCEN